MALPLQLSSTVEPEHVRVFIFDFYQLKFVSISGPVPSGPYTHTWPYQLEMINAHDIGSGTSLEINLAL